jgi:hypothetical protein
MILALVVRFVILRASLLLLPNDVRVAAAPPERRRLTGLCSLLAAVCFSVMSRQGLLGIKRFELPLVPCETVHTDLG